jgi:hypothetical protein
MKTTVDIADALFDQARSYAKARGMTMRTMIETGLRLTMARPAAKSERFKLQDFSFGGTPAVPDLTVHSDPSTWRDLGNRQWGIADTENEKAPSSQALAAQVSGRGA